MTDTAPPVLWRIAGVFRHTLPMPDVRTCLSHLAECCFLMCWPPQIHGYSQKTKNIPARYESRPFTMCSRKKASVWSCCLSNNKFLIAGFTERAAECRPSYFLLYSAILFRWKAVHISAWERFIVSLQQWSDLSITTCTRCVRVLAAFLLCNVKTRTLCISRTFHLLCRSASPWYHGIFRYYVNYAVVAVRTCQKTLL